MKPFSTNLENNTKTIVRSTGLDILRSCAIFFVISGHFFTSYTHLETVPFEGISLYVQASFLPLFHIGVPLFIILTGYLNCNKRIERTYFRGIWRVLIAYLFFAVLTLLYRKFYLDEMLSVRNAVGLILRFNAVPYGWYIEMWIGLYLFTPFLNVLYKAIPTQKQKQIGLIILFAMTLLPELLNRYGFHLVPGFWKECFPLTFFFIGSYIREFQPKISWRKGWSIIIACCLINPIFNLLFIKQPHVLITIVYGNTGFFGALIGTPFFLLFYQKELQSSFLKKIFTKVSLLSLDIYLCSYIFDSFYYGWLKEHYSIDQSQYAYLHFIVVPICFLSSFGLSYLKELLFKVTRLNRI